MHYRVNWLQFLDCRLRAAACSMFQTSPTLAGHRHQQRSGQRFSNSLNKSDREKQWESPHLHCLYHRPYSTVTGRSLVSEYKQYNCLNTSKLHFIAQLLFSLQLPFNPPSLSPTSEEWFENVFAHSSALTAKQNSQFGKLNFKKSNNSLYNTYPL